MRSLQFIVLHSIALEQWKWSTNCDLFLLQSCPVKVRMTKFIYDRSTGIADATLFSMFRFADSSEVHFQCDIAVCRGKTHPVNDFPLASRYECGL